MILSAQSIRARCSITKITPLIDPFHERTNAILTFGESPKTLTFGLSPSGYDIRIAQDVIVSQTNFVLASSLERFSIPNDLTMRILDKSSWARMGIVVQTTVAEPGWCGYLTLELSNNSPKPISIPKGSPIAQVQFELLDHPTEQPYQGKYQDQPSRPVEAI